MAADCGGQLQTVETQEVNFITNNGRGNGLDSGSGSTMTCITPGTTTYKNVQRDVYLFGSGNSPYDKSKYVSVTYKVATGTTGGGHWSYQFSNFIININAKMDMFYRTVSGENHLIVKLYDIKSYLVGPSQNINRVFQAGLYCAGNISYALAASLVPAAPVAGSSAWRKCLGGWWSAAPIDPCSQGACPEGESHQAPGGGTMYWWGQTNRYDSKFVHNGNNPSRSDGPIEWDMGVITDFQNANVYIFGRMMQGGDNSCNGAVFRGSTSYQGLAFKVPVIKVCPPELVEITQDRDICANCAITDFKFKPNDLLGIDEGVLQIDYVYNSPDLSKVNWANAETKSWVISKNTDIEVEIPCLVSGTHYCWRAKIIVQKGTFKGESEYTYGCFDTLYIPERTWVVPDISDEECQLLSRGGYVEQFEEKP